VGTGIPVTIRALIHELCDVLGRRREDVTVTEAEPTAGDPRYNVADISQLTALGVQPHVSLHEGLERLVQARTSQASEARSF